MCYITFPHPHFGYDYETEQLRQRLNQLRKEEEKARLRRQIEDLELQLGRRSPGIYPMPPRPLFPNSDDIVRLLERQRG